MYIRIKNLRRIYVLLNTIKCCCLDLKTKEKYINEIFNLLDFKTRGFKK